MNISRKLNGLLEKFYYHMKASFVETLLIVKILAAAGELSRDQNSRPLQFWPKTVIDVLTRKWIER